MLNNSYSSVTDECEMVRLSISEFVIRRVILQVLPGYLKIVIIAKITVLPCFCFHINGQNLLIQKLKLRAHNVRGYWIGQWQSNICQVYILNSGDIK